MSGNSMRRYSKSELIAESGVCKNTINYLIKQGYLECEQPIPGGMEYYTVPQFNKAMAKATQAAAELKRKAAETLTTPVRTLNYPKSKRKNSDDAEMDAYIKELKNKHYSTPVIPLNTSRKSG